MSADRIDALSRSLADSTSRRSLLQLLGVGVAGTAVAAVGLNEALAKNNKNNNGNVNTTYENQMTNLAVRGKGKKGTFKGQFSIERFENRSGTIYAVGTLTGKVTGDRKERPQSKRVDQEAAFPVQVTTQQVTTAATCTILDLVLGPIDLTLLGLRLRTNTIRIRLTAQTGTLLGDLLCPLVGGIDLGNVNDLLGLLNRILCRLLGGTNC